MICLAIANPDIEILEGLAQKNPQALVEIRLDGVNKPLNSDRVKELFQFPLTSIATCRPTDRRNESERKIHLIQAVQAGAAYVDIEIEADETFKKELIAEARKHNCTVIISYHNFEDTPGAQQLQLIVDQCFEQGADIAKVACRVHSQEDCAHILSLYGCRYEHEPNGRTRIVALGMGEKGKITRVAAPLLGAPFTFASTDDGKETAPGQMDERTLKEIYRLMEIQ